MESPSVDRGFMRNLKALDKRLGVKFNGSHFVITYDRGYGEPVNLCLVKTDSGDFRQPDMREIKLLHEGDMATKNARLELERRAYELQRSNERSERKTKEFIRDMTKDDSHTLANAFRKVTGIGKNAPKFRQIAYKPKGQVF